MRAVPLCAKLWKASSARSAAMSGWNGRPWAVRKCPVALPKRCPLPPARKAWPLRPRPPRKRRARRPLLLKNGPPARMRRLRRAKRPNGPKSPPGPTRPNGRKSPPRTPVSPVAAVVAVTRPVPPLRPKPRPRKPLPKMRLLKPATVAARAAVPVPVLPCAVRAKAAVASVRRPRPCPRLWRTPKTCWMKWRRACPSPLWRNWIPSVSKP